MERRSDLGDLRAKTLQHRLDHVIAQDDDAAFFELRRQMTITKMPGQFRQMPAIPWRDLVERFIRRNDLGHPPILENKHVAMLERDSLGQIDKDLFAQL